MKTIVTIDKDLADIVPGYLENRKNEVALFRECIAKKDFGQLLVLGHRLAGNAASYGFAPLTEQGRLIEKDAKAQTTEKMNEYVDFIESYLSNIDVKYE